MILELQQKSAFIGRKPHGFTEKYYTEWDDGLGKTKISMFLVMSISSTQIPGEEIGKDAFQLLQDHFLDDLSGDPYDRFENALREINLMINEKEKHYGIKFVPNMQVLCGVIDRDMLFLSQRGDSQGYLIRKRHVSSITEGLFDEKNTEDLFQNIASGALEVNDTVVLVTGKLVQYVTPSDLSKIFSEQSLDEALKELTDLLKSDLEEQMAVLSFEVLEKTQHAPVMSAHRGLDREESDLKEGKSVSRARAALAKVDLKKHLDVLRDWAERQERFKAFKNIRTWGRDKILIAIVIVLVVLGGGTAYLLIHGSKQRVIDSMNSKLVEAEQAINTAETRGTFEKEEAAGLLNNAEKLSIEVLNSGYLRGKASELLDRVQQERDYLDNIVHIDDELTKLADFSAVTTEKIKGLAPYGEKILVYSDTGTYQVLLDSVETPVAVPAGESIIAGTYFKDKDVVLMLGTSGKLLEYDGGNIQYADTADVTWNSGKDIETYSTKVYFLDSVNKQIWRYNRTHDSYSSAATYLGSDVDISNAVSFAIDGAVWVLNSDGTLLKLLSGDPIDFAINKAPLNVIQSGAKIYTDLELNQIYVLDSAQNRIYVYSKTTKNDDLTYSGQYILDTLSEKMVDMYFDKDQSALFFVTENGLYKIKF